MRTNVLVVLIWVKTVCKGYQQMKKVTLGKERVKFECMLSSEALRLGFRLSHHHLSFVGAIREGSGESGPTPESSLVTVNTVKPVLSGHSKRRPKFNFKTNYRLMQVKSIAECSKGSILQYFRPSLSYHLS